MSHGEFSIKSDEWSFGITLIEMRLQMAPRRMEVNGTYLNIRRFILICLGMIICEIMR